MARVKTPEIPPLVKLLVEDRRYKLEAYQFVRKGLNYAQEVLGLGDEAPGSLGAEPDPDDDDAAGGQAPRPPRHVTGQDLCHALRRLATYEFGLMAKLVLGSWGIHSTSDFGEIVYNLIRIGEMSKSNGDRREDFDDVYDFDQALVREFAITKEE
ncbi:MAG: hypothetical protein L0211_25790 [Planctomycetaceae bacterium]|nr:hypothetical protein [Planctomycetaceae bacterium]